MNNYRVKEVKNTITGDTKYIAQIKLFFWWRNCQRELGWGCSEKAGFSNRASCENFIRERRVEDAWDE